MYSCDSDGWTRSLTDNRGTILMAYETDSNRVSSVTDPVTGATGYTYLLSGERASMTLPGGGTWTYNYSSSPIVVPKHDPNSMSMRLTSIVDDQGREVDYTIGELGRVYTVKDNQTFNGGALSSYCESDYTYDGYVQGGIGSSHLWLNTLKTTWNWKVGGTWSQSTLAQNVYSYDNAANRLTNQITDNTGAQRTEQYGYDELNRLTSVNYGDGQTQGYTFDNMGNRTQKTDSVNGNESYTYNGANILTTRAGLTYNSDTDGNTTGWTKDSNNSWSGTWDGQNRMLTCTDKVSGVTHNNTFVYAADGLRHRATVDGTTTDFVVAGQNTIREMLWSNNTHTNTATYLTGATGPAYRYDNQANSIRWYLYDGLGSVLAEVDPSGNVTTFRKYDVYGAVRSYTGTGTSKHKFVGQLGHPSEDETGLIYMRARYYDPTLGRFVSEDPARQGSNWLVYAADMPTRLTDRSGADAGDAEIAAEIMRWIVQSGVGPSTIKTVLRYALKILDLCGRDVAVQELLTMARIARPLADITAGAAELRLGQGLSYCQDEIDGSIAQLKGGATIIKATKGVCEAAAYAAVAWWLDSL